MGTIYGQEDEKFGQHGIEEYINAEEVGEAFKQGMTSHAQASDSAEARTQQNVGRAAAMPAPVSQCV